MNDVMFQDQIYHIYWLSYQFFMAFAGPGLGSNQNREGVLDIADFFLKKTFGEIAPPL